MGLYSTGDCFRHDVTVTPHRPILKVAIETLISQRSEILEAPVDTGFAGFLMTPSKLYVKLSEMEVPEEHFLTYSTLIGPITMRRAKVRIRIFDHSFESFLETPQLGLGKLLLGRRILNLLPIAILGPENRTCTLRIAEAV